MSFSGPFPSGNRIPGDGDSIPLARSLAGTGTLKARFLFPANATIPGSQRTICMPGPRASFSCCVAGPVTVYSAYQLNWPYLSLHLVCLPPVCLTGFPYHMLFSCVTCSLQNCPPGSSMIRNVLKTVLFFGNNDLGSNKLWSREFQTLEG